VHPATTSRHSHPSKIARAAACALTLGLVSAASLAQSLFDETRFKKQFPPTLTPDTASAEALARRAPGSGVDKKVTPDAERGSGSEVAKPSADSELRQAPDRKAFPTK